jgi:hypothetical protein
MKTTNFATPNLLNRATFGYLSSDTPIRNITIKIRLKLVKITSYAQRANP